MTGSFVTATTFLSINGVTLLHDTEELYMLTMETAQGRMDKAAIARELRRLAERVKQAHVK